jgi:hypothetical protein
MPSKAGGQTGAIQSRSRIPEVATLRLSSSERRSLRFCHSQKSNIPFIVLQKSAGINAGRLGLFKP